MMKILSDEYKVKIHCQERSTIYTAIETITSDIYYNFLEQLEKNQIHPAIFQLLNVEEFEVCFGKTKEELKSLMAGKTDN